MIAYDHEGIVIHNAGANDVLPTLADDSIDIVVTSPPYNMGLIPGGNGRGMYRPGAGNKAGRFRAGYDGDNDDAKPYEEYVAWQRAILAECWRIARVAVFYNHRPRVEHGVLRRPLDDDFGGIPLRQVIIWDRKTGIDVNPRHFCTSHEEILVFAKDAFKMTHAASGMGTVWRMGMETKVKDHPAPFPIELPARCIRATGATSVLDPFLGSGSTLRAAKDAGIAGVGIEKSAAFCDLAARRLGQEVLPL